MSKVRAVESEGLRMLAAYVSEACATECKERIAVYDDGKAAVCKQLAFSLPKQWDHYDSIDQLPDMHQRRIAVLNMVAEDIYVPGVGIRMRSLISVSPPMHRVYWIVPDP
jgi:hypothetical protein